MGEMAEDAYLEWLIESYEEEAEMQLEHWKKAQQRKQGNNAVQGNSFRNNLTMHYTEEHYTEDVLNRKAWVTGDGEVIEVENMEESHIRNTLNYLYKNRDKYWLRCRDGKLLNQFENGEDFFQRVIRRSTLWNELIRVLTEDKAVGFNFSIDVRGLGRE